MQSFPLLSHTAWNSRISLFVAAGTIKEENGAEFNELRSTTGIAVEPG